MPLWWLHLAYDKLQFPMVVQVDSGGDVVVIRILLSDQIPTCLVLCISGIKLQLLCCVRIELA